jgi:hypothetical protein
MEKRDYVIDLSALIVAFIRFYPPAPGAYEPAPGVYEWNRECGVCVRECRVCQRFVLRLRPEAAL